MFKRKTRQIHFTCIFCVESLEEVPINAAYVYIVWELRNKKGLPKANCTGKTSGKPVTRNRVEWQEMFKTKVILSVNQKTNCLNHYYMDLSTYSKKTTYSSVQKLGKVSIDLAEYARCSRFTKSFLMRESLLNSTLKVTLEMIQESGDRLFKW